MMMLAELSRWLLYVSPASAGPQSYSWADGLLTGGLVMIGGATMMVSGVYLRRRATRQWQDVSDLDGSYSAVFKRTIYRAERVKWVEYVIAAIYVLGSALLIASAFAALVGD